MYLVIVAGFFVRLYLALSRTDMFWADEHFQTLEPAAKAIFGYGTLSWEWVTGYRPWIVPGFYMPLFAVCKLVGVTGGQGIVFASRAFTALFTGSILFSLNRLLKQFQISEFARLIAVGALAFSAPMVLWSCATLADTWAMVAIWWVLPPIVARVERAKAKDWFWIGVLAGLPMLVKVQMAFWLVGLGAALVFKRARPKFLAFMALGLSVDLLALGLLDFVTWGVPFKSLITQASMGPRVSRSQGVEPWWFYFRQVLADQGWLLFAALGGLVFMRRKELKKLKSYIVVALPSLSLLVILSAVPHKETRFLLPMFPFFFFTLGVLVDSARFSFKLRTPVVAALSLALVVGVAYRCKKTRLPMSSVTISDLEQVIYQQRGLSRDGRECVLLVDHHWTWTRGQLALGGPVRVVEEKIGDLKSDELANCKYAIMPKQNETPFRAKATASWSSIASTENGYALWGRK